MVFDTVGISFGNVAICRLRKLYDGAYTPFLSLNKIVGYTIVGGWSQFECNFNVFADMILPFGSHCIDMTASPRTYQRRYRHVVVVLCSVWLGERSRAPALWRHDPNVDDQNIMVLPIVGVNLPCLWKKNCHQNTMLLSRKECKFKDENLKILRR